MCFSLSNCSQYFYNNVSNDGVKTAWQYFDMCKIFLFMPLFWKRTTFLLSHLHEYSINIPIYMLLCILQLTNMASVFLLFNHRRLALLYLRILKNLLISKSFKMFKSRCVSLLTRNVCVGLCVEPANCWLGNAQSRQEAMCCKVQ